MEDNDDDSVPSPPPFFRVSGHFTVLNPSRPMVLAKILENTRNDESQSTTMQEPADVPDLVFDPKASQTTTASSPNSSSVDFMEDIAFDDLLPNDMDWEVHTLEDTKRTTSSMNEFAVDATTDLGVSLRDKDGDQTKNEPTSRRHARWRAEEDDLLRKAVQCEEGPPHNWKLIAEKYFHGSRNAFACKGRWNKNLQPGLTHGKWTEREDNIILLGHRVGLSWPQIAQKLTGRPPEQIRNRFLNEIDPTLNRESFSEAERRQLIYLQAQYGNKWTQIAREMPGRSEKMVKNYWNNAKLGRRHNDAEHASTNKSK